MSSFRFDEYIPSDQRRQAGSSTRQASPLRVVAERRRPGQASHHETVEQQRAERHVARENASASRLGPEDSRRIMAIRVIELLEGGRAAILRPESREKLLRVGRVMGLRPFDTSLVIAVVQDAARRGEALDAPEAEARLDLIGRPRVPGDPARREDVSSWATTLAIALALSLATMLVMLFGLMLRAGG